MPWCPDRYSPGSTEQVLNSFTILSNVTTAFVWHHTSDHPLQREIPTRHGLFKNTPKNSERVSSSDDHV